MSVSHGEIRLISAMRILAYGDLSYRVTKKFITRSVWCILSVCSGVSLVCVLNVYS